MAALGPVLVFAAPPGPAQYLLRRRDVGPEQVHEKPLDLRPGERNQIRHRRSTEFRASPLTAWACTTVRKAWASIESVM